MKTLESTKCHVLDVKNIYKIIKQVYYANKYLCKILILVFTPTNSNKR